MKPNDGNSASDIQTKSILFIVILGLVVIAIVLITICWVELTNRESTLLGTILTFISIAIGWGISHFYSIKDKERAVEEVREFEQKNLRTYALKAAEKVTNLSKELNRLSAYLQEELQYTEYRNAEEELFAKEERIESAIHMLASLRSINDTSLSDWQGVIGEELDERRETEFVRVEALSNITERLNAIEANSTNAEQPSASEHSEEIQTLKRELRLVASELSGMAFRPRTKSAYLHMEIPCPACKEKLTYKQRTKENELKAVQCKHCKASYVAKYTDATGSVLRLREIIQETPSCPTCSSTITIGLDEFPSASKTCICTNCNDTIRVSRADEGRTLRVATLTSRPKTSATLSTDILDLVKVSMPPQPWEKGVTETVAKEIGLSPQVVKKAVQHLIRSGVFSDQINGQLCTAAEKLALMRSLGSDIS